MNIKACTTSEPIASTSPDDRFPRLQRAGRSVVDAGRVATPAAMKADDDPVDLNLSKIMPIFARRKRVRDRTK